MNPSIWSSYFHDLPPEEMVKSFSGKGWFMSEISDEHGAMLLERGNPSEVGKSFGQYASDHGMSFPQGHLWLYADIAAANQVEVINKLKRWIDLFMAVGVRKAVLHPGGREMMGNGCSPEEIHESRVRALDELLKYLHGTDMVICLENIFVTAPECDDLLNLINVFNSRNLGICLDTGHLNMCSGKQAEFIKKAGAHLKALHIADNEGATDQHLMPFGKGTVEWDKVMPALKEIDYKGLFNYEIPGESRCPLPVRLAKLDYLKKVTEYLLK